MLRKWLALAFICLSVLAIAGSASSAKAPTGGINFLTNGDFETGNQSPWLWTIGHNGYETITSNPALGAHSLEMFVTQGGQYSFGVGGGGSPCPGYWDSTFRPVPVAPNTAYYLSAFSYVPSDPGIYPYTTVIVIWYSACSADYGLSQSDLPSQHGPYDRWVQSSGVVTSPPAAQFALVAVLFNPRIAQFPANFDNIFFGVPPPPTATPTPSITPLPTNTPLPTATPAPPRCPGERFTDVCPGDYFYAPVLSLSDANIISGYSSSPPCLTPAHVPCYLPYNNVTRGQTAKIVSLAAEFNEPVSGQGFADVAPGSTFYEYVERLANRGIIGGYPCGGPSEPCVPPDNLPYFRVGRSVTRGQVSKMTSAAFGYVEPVTGQTFEDVPTASTFYQFVERMADRGIISGYPCGNPEPCVPPSNRPYFRPNNPVTRGQTAKILYLARLQVPPTPTPTSTPTPTPTLTATATMALPTGTPTEVATPTATGTSAADNERQHP